MHRRHEEQEARETGRLERESNVCLQCTQCVDWYSGCSPFKSRVVLNAMKDVQTLGLARRGYNHDVVACILRSRRYGNRAEYGRHKCVLRPLYPSVCLSSIHRSSLMRVREPSSYQGVSSPSHTGLLVGSRNFTSY